jgi:hypothetical protein
MPRKFKVLLKSDKNNGKFLHERPIHIFGLSRSVLLRMRNVSDKSGTENRNTYEGGPKYFRNLNLPHKRDVVQGSATRYGEPTIF